MKCRTFRFARREPLYFYLLEHLFFSVPLEIPFYTGKVGFYQEKQKFDLENDVFYRKNFRYAVFQWKRWFLSVKT